MDDFGDTLSDESMVTIRSIFDEIYETLKNDVQKIGDELLQFYTQKEAQIVDIYEWNRQLLFGHKNMSKIQLTISQDLFHQIVNTLNTLEISVPSNNLQSISRNIQYIDILNKISNYNPTSAPNILHGLNKTKTYLDNSCEWYKFLIDFYLSLTTYDVQNKISNINFTVNVTDVTDGASVKDIGLKSILKSINNSKYGDVEALLVNKYQLKALKMVWDQMKTNNSTAVCDQQKLTVMQKFVKISDVIEMKCWKTANLITIFALNTLFIDADINKSGSRAQIIFIAPTWRISGEREINLNGVNGRGAQQGAIKAPNGDTIYKDGIRGLNGVNGGVAGHFFGIGKTFFDSNLLIIYANGGKGGDAQNGGDGFNGTDCDDPPLSGSFSDLCSSWEDAGIYFEKYPKHRKEFLWLEAKTPGTTLS